MSPWVSWETPMPNLATPTKDGEKNMYNLHTTAHVAKKDKQGRTMMMCRFLRGSRKSGNQK